MGLTKDEAYKILKLDSGASEQRTIKHFKILALENFPKEEVCNPAKLKVFGDICQAANLLLDCKTNITEPNEMLSFFQFLFFKNTPISDDEETSNSCDDSDDDNDEIFEDNLKRIEAMKSKEKKNEIQANKNAKDLILEEERAKKKAEKKKTQKKKRKERKKQEKMAEQTQEKSPKKGGTDNENTINGESSSESEEDIDHNSAFVKVIAKKKINIPQVMKKENEKMVTVHPSKAPLIQEDPATRVLRSRELAVRGNQMANTGHYNEAIELFSEAIKLDPSDHRFYSNRSYCYDRIGNYDRALNDANKSISILPKWPKGHFRKGRALANLKKFSEAEASFKEVLKLDSNCDEAAKELHDLKVIQLMEMGFSRLQAESALEKHNTLNQALESLLKKNQALVATPRINRDSDVFSSDDDNEVMMYFKNYEKASLLKVSDEKMDPSNPENCNSLWIGNVQPQLSENALKYLFEKYGEILSIKPMYEKFCAFVNYKDPKSAGLAMKGLQGVELYGARLVIRFPNTDKTKSTKTATSPNSVAKPKVAPVGDECYFWRTTGCTKQNACKYKHIPKNKGIDKVMKK